MAKRKQLEAPTQDHLREIEEGFARETRRDPLGLSVPIASVVAEAAALTQTQPTEERAEQARDRKDAARLREAEANGLLVQNIALSEIVADDMLRDRMALDAEEMAELKTSILSHGLRLPIEVFELAVPQAGRRYGLISGYRRLNAFKSILAERGDARFSSIPALIRQSKGAAEAFVSMVEENEIRSGLSQYERGRVAVIATENGAFDTVEHAVDALFASGSKAKRSKLRSFALIHEDLGDLLRFPQALSERQGLRVAGALRAGLTEKLRASLSASPAEHADAEWQVLEAASDLTVAPPRESSKGGRPREVVTDPVTEIADGIFMQHRRDARGHVIRLSGDRLSDDKVQHLLDAIAEMLRSE